MQDYNSARKLAESMAPCEERDEFLAKIAADQERMQAILA
jgi:hypothetical protein